MVALTQDRNTARRAGVDFVDPMAANVTIFGGAIVVLDALGNAGPGATGVGLIARGVAVERKVNGPTIGAEKIRTQACVGVFANSGAADAITRAEIGDDCWIVDDQTVAKTDGGATRSKAGKIVDVSAEGVSVRIGF